MLKLALNIGLLPLALSALLPAGSATPGEQHVLGHTSAAEFQCDLPPVQTPPSDGLPSSDIFLTKKALKKQVKRHSAIVSVPSICFDDLGDFDTDDRWLPFYDLHDELKKQFPLVYKHTKVEKVNTFGLVYTLKGSDSSLEPILLTAHQDVVPVADPSTWTYPPFEGYYDGTYLWGRGSSDDKNSLVALMSALESLLSNKSWKPRRTVILAFGFDEECSGRRGAGSIAKHLEKVWGTGSIAMVLDEGGMGLQLLGNDTLYALPAVHEKGHMDVHLDLHVNGGHSSIPFPHTGIGIIAEMVVALESHPYTPQLIKGSPIYNHLVCQARYSPEADEKITELLEKGDLEALTIELASTDRSTNFRIQTSQSVDLINGGVKINAMPEVVSLGVNYRIAPQNSAVEIQQNVVKYIQPIVEKYSLTVKDFVGDAEYEAARDSVSSSTGEKLSDDVKPLYDVSYNGTLVLSATQVTKPAPISPTINSSVWDLFSGTIQYSFGFPDGAGKVIPVGELMTGNTDTRHYLGLSENVYRFTPTRAGASFNAHTIDEKIDMGAHMEALKFYYDIIRVFDQADL